MHIITYNLPTSSIPSVELHLFDRLSNNFILEIILLPIYFPSSGSMVQDFYIIPLDFSCSLVFGYNWFTQHNLLIDQISGSISFHPSLQKNLASVCATANTPLVPQPSSGILLPSPALEMLTPTNPGTSISYPEQSHITIKAKLDIVTF